MIHSNQDLKYYISKDTKRWSELPSLKDWFFHNEKWFIRRYLILLRKVEYYLNCYGKKNPLFLWYWFRFKRLGFKLRFTIYPNTIGPGLMIYHTGDFIFIKQSSSIGCNCTLRPGVVIGKKNDEGEFDAPVVVGDNVTFGLGVRVFGKISIGDNVTIGANAVVTKDIPDNSVCGGIPAKIIKTND